MTGWVRIDDLAGADLPAEAKVRLMADAIEWLGVAQAMVMIHGRERGLRRLTDLGCPVRPGEDGAPMIWAGQP
jgi:hypothetical protein